MIQQSAIERLDLADLDGLIAELEIELTAMHDASGARTDEVICPCSCQGSCTCCTCSHHC